MLRTQIYLTEPILIKLKKAKRLNKKPFASIVREILERNIDNYLSHSLKPNGNSLKEILNLKLTGAPRDLSTKMDDYLYGE